MKKYLITGCSGFVSYHFLQFIENNGISSCILGIDNCYPKFPTKNFKYICFKFIKINLIDIDNVGKIICEFKPDYIIHLASYSSVGFSWKEPILSFQNNTNIYLNLIESVRKQNLKTRILSIGSSEEYGNVSKEECPLTEEKILNPNSPYAVARVSQEMLSIVYSKSYNIDIVMTRSFNHFGPFQKDIFVISSIAKQLVFCAKNGLKEGKILTGNLNIVRDFTDVRDVVSAYYNLLLKGESGGIYNVCSGKGVSLLEIAGKIANMLNIQLKIDIDKKLIRPTENNIIVGSNIKLIKHTDWNMKYSLEKSLVDIISYWKSEF